MVDDEEFDFSPPDEAADDVSFVSFDPLSALAPLSAFDPPSADEELLARLSVR